MDKSDINIENLQKANKTLDEVLNILINQNKPKTNCSSMHTKITKVDDKLCLYAPYNFKIVNSARKMGGKWKSDCWVFDYDSDVEQSLKKLVEKVFNFKLDGDYAPAYITIKDTIYELQEPLVIGGVILASARGRDSGAEVGKGVVILEGNIDSGGSMKNWKTYAYEGTKFKVKCFPKEYTIPEDIKDCVEISFIEE
jgi:hypothetical protein